MQHDLADLDAGDTLTAVEGALRVKRSAEAEILRLAVHWADLHPGLPDPATGPRLHDERQILLGGDGTPVVAEFAAAELAVSLEIHPLSARHLLADALDLRFRLPRLWALVVAELRIPDWVARKIAKLTRHLDRAVVAEIDRRIGEEAHGLPTSRLLDLVEAMVMAADHDASEEERQDGLARRFVTISDHSSRPGTTGVYGCLDAEGAHHLDATIGRLAEALKAAGDADSLDVRRAKALALLGNPALALKYLIDLDPDLADSELAEAIRKLAPGSLAPRSVLNLHVTDESLFGGPHPGDEPGNGVARSLELGPLTIPRLIEILRHSQVAVRPVLDPEGAKPADAYEFTGSLRDAVLTLTPADCYPYAAGTSSAGFDVDHTMPYDDTGPPGQTRVGNGGPMTRHHHRIKTHGPLNVRQPRPGVYVWQTAHRRYRMTSQSGTHHVHRVVGDAIHDGSTMEQHLAIQLALHDARPPGRIDED